MGAAVESVVIVVIKTIKAGQVSNETSSWFYRTIYDSSDGCDSKKLYGRKEKMNSHFKFFLRNNIIMRSFFRSSEGGFFVVIVTETSYANLCRTKNLIDKVMLKALHLTDTSEEKIYTE